MKFHVLLEIDNKSQGGAVYLITEDELRNFDFSSLPDDYKFLMPIMTILAENELVAMDRVRAILSEFLVQESR